MMLLKRIRFIVIIVSCSLLGIFLLQGYWLYNSYQLSAEKFNKEISKIMQALQRKYVIADMQVMGITLNSEIGQRMLGQEDDRVGEFIQVFHDLTDSIHYKWIGKTGKKQDTLKKNIKFMISKPDVDTIRHSKGKADKQKTFVYNLSAVYYRENDFQGIVTPLRKTLDSLMQLNGIRTPYALKLSNIASSADTYYTDSILYHQLQPKLPHLKVGVLKPFYLDLSLANDNLFILRKMQWVLIASILIIGITSWSFLYMLRTIFQQKRLSAIKNDFFNNMTHEFKTPITTVSLAVEALKNEEVTNNGQRLAEYLTICEHELKRIAAMIDKVLKMAAFEKSEVSLIFRKTNVQELVERVVATMQPQLAKKQAKLLTFFSPNIPMLTIDSDHMANVLYNLLENSLKYTTKTPEIKIECRYDDGNSQLLLRVRDNGIGIPVIYQDKIFENFFRVPTGDIHNVKGFGMGLSYVSAIVSMHNGTIELNSKLNEGSTFSIKLPIA